MSRKAVAKILDNRDHPITASLLKPTVERKPKCEFIVPTTKTILLKENAILQYLRYERDGTTELYTNDNRQTLNRFTVVAATNTSHAALYIEPATPIITQAQLVPCPNNCGKHCKQNGLHTHLRSCPERHHIATLTMTASAQSGILSKCDYCGEFFKKLGAHIAAHKRKGHVIQLASQSS